MTWGGPDTIEGAGLLPHVAARGQQLGSQQPLGLGLRTRTARAPCQPSHLGGHQLGSQSSFLGLGLPIWGWGGGRGARAQWWSLLGWSGP